MVAAQGLTLSFLTDGSTPTEEGPHGQEGPSSSGSSFSSVVFSYRQLALVDLGAIPTNPGRTSPWWQRRR